MEEKILAALAKTQEQVTALQAQMDKRFDVVDRKVHSVDQRLRRGVQVFVFR